MIGRQVVSRGTLVIDVEACKGCDLCIDACPPNVLVMTTHQVNTRGYRYPELMPGCTGCKACSQVCPDFVFQVYKYDTPQVRVVDDLPDGVGGRDGPEGG
jgi:2-oxoglutarate ferredoxin oxidoreductase subunit delta